MLSNVDGAVCTARCYCGETKLAISAAPLSVAYCHCNDCKRWTGSPLPAFAAFSQNDLRSDLGPALELVPGVKRWICKACGSPMAATFDYYPDQVYVPVGVLDQADAFPPQIHCYSAHQLKWLHLDDGLERASGTGRNSSALSAGN